MNASSFFIILPYFFSFLSRISGEFTFLFPVPRHGLNTLQKHLGVVGFNELKSLLVLMHLYPLI